MDRLLYMEHCIPLLRKALIKRTQLDLRTCTAVDNFKMWVEYNSLL